MAEFLQIEVDQGVALLTLRRPPLNILSQAFVRELADAAERLAGDGGVGAVVLWGGGRHFSAGADVPEFAGVSVAGVHEYGKALDRAFGGLARLPQVTIAAVNGYALGGGCELALTADFRFAGDRATFGLPEIALGLIPGAGGTQRLPRLIGPARAKDLIFSGRQVRAEEALALGLADVVVPADEVLERSLAVARSYARGPLVALRAAKQAIDAPGSLADGLALERALFSMLFGTGDWQRGAASFVEQGPGMATFAGD